MCILKSSFVVQRWKVRLSQSKYPSLQCQPFDLLQYLAVIWSTGMFSLLPRTPNSMLCIQRSHIIYSRKFVFQQAQHSTHLVSSNWMLCVPKFLLMQSILTKINAEIDLHCTWKHAWPLSATTGLHTPGTVVFLNPDRSRSNRVPPHSRFFFC